jgi:EAL domain-containing protein (putative c-di-GMP-specific phosphodiesterase class I)
MEQTDFLPRLTTLLESSEIDPYRFTIEITEGIMINNTVATSDILATLRSLGFSISIDDFGTGYSNVSYLTELHADRIKIDRSFIMNLYSENGTLDPRAATIVETMVFMAKALGIGILAEGIESQQEAALLREYGCESFQGYLFGRPAEAAS